MTHVKTQGLVCCRLSVAHIGRIEGLQPAQQRAFWVSARLPKTDTGAPNLLWALSFDPFVSSAQCPPFCTSSPITVATCWVGDSLAQASPPLIPSHSLFAHFCYLFVFLPASFFCLCSPGYILTLSFRRCQPRLCEAFLLLHVALCSFAEDSWAQLV